MKADLAKEWLSTEGFKYEVDKDGDVHFRYQGKNLYFTVDEKDDQFFRLIMPGIYDIEGDREKVLEACNTITRDMKVVKAIIVNDSVWLSIEMFVDTTPELGDFFERCCDIMLAAYQRAASEILN